MQTVQVQSTDVQTEKTHNDIASLHEQIKSLNTECQSLRDKVHKLESVLTLHNLMIAKLNFSQDYPIDFHVIVKYVSSVLNVTAKQSLKPSHEFFLQ